MTRKATISATPSEQTKPECFAIMPVSDPEGYEKGHFRHVYDDLVCPACDRAGFSAVLASDVKETNLIHLDILQRLLRTPMAVCDLISRNPNVMFELALRQAFDMPVALIQEYGTPPVFDISPLRAKEYHRELRYHDVLADQVTVSEAIRETFDASRSGRGANSIVTLLALGKVARLPDPNRPEMPLDLLKLIYEEISDLRGEIRGPKPPHPGSTTDRLTWTDIPFWDIIAKASYIEGRAGEAATPRQIREVQRELSQVITVLEWMMHGSPDNLSQEARAIMGPFYERLLRATKTLEGRATDLTRKAGDQAE